MIYDLWQEEFMSEFIAKRRFTFITRLAQLNYDLHIGIYGKEPEEL